MKLLRENMVVKL